MKEGAGRRKGGGKEEVGKGEGRTKRCEKRKKGHREKGRRDKVWIERGRDRKKKERRRKGGNVGDTKMRGHEGIRGKGNGERKQSRKRG